MSYTTLVHIFPNERVECDREFRNSWGSAPVIWDLMSQKYLGKEPHRYLSSDMEPLWQLWKNPEIPAHHRAVLMMTFDKAYVAKKDYPKAAKDISKFFVDFFYSDEYVNHWNSFSEIFASDPEVPGIGFWHTSVSENPFNGAWNEEKEEYDPPDWNEIYDIYSAIESTAV